VIRYSAAASNFQSTFGTHSQNARRRICPALHSLMVRFVYERAREHAREIQGKVYRKFVFFC
jgi:hypothetical protein